MREIPRALSAIKRNFIIFESSGVGSGKEEEPGRAVSGHVERCGTLSRIRGQDSEKRTRTGGRYYRTKVSSCAQACIGDRTPLMTVRTFIP